MLVPYTVDVPMERWPFANWALMAVTAVVSLGLFVADIQRHKLRPLPTDLTESVKEIDRLRRELDEPRAPTGSLQRGDAFRLWQLVSYTLVHADPLHLIGNMVFLFCFGNAVNAKLGHGLFLGLYFLLGAVAGLAWLGLGRGPALVGASGAIMGVVGLFLVLYPNNDVSIFYWFGLSWMGSFEARSWVVALVGMASDLFGTLFNGGGAVAYVCHLGGVLVGVAIGLALVARGLAPPSEGEQNLLQMWGVHPPTKRRRRRTAPLPVSRAQPGDDRPLNREDWA